jgi:hypothetical protein
MLLTFYHQTGKTQFQTMKGSLINSGVLTE